MSDSIRGTVARRGGAALAIAAIVGLSACSSSSSSSGGAAGTGASATAASTAAAGLAYAKSAVARYEAPANPPVPAKLADVPDLKGKTVWFIPFIDTVPVQSTTGTAMASALAALGATVHTCDGAALPTTMAACMNEAVSQHAAVVTAFIDYDLVPAGFQALEKAHIPVLVGGSTPTGGQTSSTEMAFFDALAFSNFRSRLAADLVIADSDGKGDILVTELTDSSINSA